MKTISFPAILLLLLCLSCHTSEERLLSDALPPIYPDYTDVTIPLNIAPLNFLLRNHPSEVELIVRGASQQWVIRSKGEQIRFPAKRWRSLLASEKGGELVLTLAVRLGKQWTQYADFHWTVVGDSIDPYLSYRLIEPGYEVWNEIQLRERNIETFNERVLADNRLLAGACMNCHIYAKQDPNLSLFHLRGRNGGSILNRNGQLRKLNTATPGMSSSAVYGSLHPDGRFGVFSTNVIIPSFHALGSERLEVYDTASELVALDFDRNTVTNFPARDTAEAGRLRTFPAFSADGQAVYYCEARAVALPDSIAQLRYSLLRVDFDTLKGNFGERVDTLFDAEREGASVSFPKTSPDGRWLLITVARYGTFPLWHREADLMLIDLMSGERDSLAAVNAACSDTYHSWSSNSRWFVFASKRDDGLYGKPYFAYIDSAGLAHKPFVLPQSNPAFYDHTLKSFNIPEFGRGPLPFDASRIEKLLGQKAESFSTFSNDLPRKH